MGNSVYDKIRQKSGQERALTDKFKSIIQVNPSFLPITKKSPATAGLEIVHVSFLLSLNLTLEPPPPISFSFCVFHTYL